MKKEDKVSMTKKLIHNAVLYLLTKIRIEQITVVQICEAAGVSRNAFYNIYHSPKDVIDEIKYNFFSDLSKTFSYSDDVFTVNKEMLVYVLNKLKGLQTAAISLLENIHYTDIITFADHMYDASENNKADRGHFEADILFFMGGTSTVLKLWIIQDRRNTADSVADYIVDLLLKN